MNPSGGSATPAELVAALGRSEGYPFPLERVQIIQTHISLLFLARDRVYKVKKPVNLGFLDFSTLERRRHFCAEEVRLNRRLAGDVYLGVVPVVRSAAGVVVAASGWPAPVGDVIEYAVEMRRLPEERMLDRLLREGGVTDADIDRIARVLAGFHDAAATGPGVDEHGTREAVRATVTANLDHLGRLDVNDRIGLNQTLLEHLRLWFHAELERQGPLLEARLRSGRVREGHGDLHAGNICLEESRVVIYDAIEFSPGLRCCDVARDLAFLFMDLDFRGFPELGHLLKRRYSEMSGDDGFDALLPLFTAHLASVRAKVDAITAADANLSAAAQADATGEARRYLQLAVAYTLSPPLVLMSGLPGTGKSWAAAHVAAPFRAALLRSDVERKRLAGMESTERPVGAAAEALYAPPMSQRTYEHLLAMAAKHLESGRAVVVDATFPDRAARAPFVALANSRGAPLVVIHLRASEAIVARRLEARAGDPGEPSDADWAVYLRASDRYEPPAEIPARQRVEHEGTTDAEALVDAVLSRLVAEAVTRGTHAPGGERSQT